MPNDSTVSVLLHFRQNVCCRNKPTSADWQARNEMGKEGKNEKEKTAIHNAIAFVSGHWALYCTSTVLYFNRRRTGGQHSHRAAKNDWRQRLLIPGNRAPQGIPGKSWGSHYHGLARVQLHSLSFKTGLRRIKFCSCFYLIGSLCLPSLIFSIIGRGMETSKCCLLKRDGADFPEGFFLPFLINRFQEGIKYQWTLHPLAWARVSCLYVAFYPNDCPMWRNTALKACVVLGYGRPLIFRA